MKYRLVIFDSDGTLADTLPWMRSIFNELAIAHGFRPVVAEDAERFRDLHGHALLRELGLPIWKLPKVLKDMRRRMAEHTGEFALFPGITDVLHRLASAKMQLAVVSSNSRENVERVLRANNVGLITHFACGVSMFGKAVKLREVLRRSRIGGNEAVYIGDEIRDAEAAAKVGMAFGAVGWGQHSTEALLRQHPDYFFKTVKEIAEVLCSANW